MQWSNTNIDTYLHMHSATHSYAHSYRNVESLCCYFSFLAHNQIPRFASNQRVGESEGEEVKGEVEGEDWSKIYNSLGRKSLLLLMNNKIVKVDFQRTNLLEKWEERRK